MHVTTQLRKSYCILQATLLHRISYTTEKFCVNKQSLIWEIVINSTLVAI